MNRTGQHLSGALAALLVLVGCERSVSNQISTAPFQFQKPAAIQSKLSPAVIGRPSVEIVRLTPVHESVVRVGQSVAVQVEAAYSLLAPTGMVGLVVQDAAGVSLVQTSEVVPRGLGKVLLKGEFVVPDTRMIHIFVPLFSVGPSDVRNGTTSSARADASYKVTR